MALILGDESIPNPSSGSVYKPKSKFSQKLEEKKEEKLFSAPVSTTKKPEKPSVSALIFLGNLGLHVE